MVIKSSDVILVEKSYDVVPLPGDEMSKKEMRIAFECLNEALWSRAIPSATVAGASIYWAVRTGKLKFLGKSRFRTWSAVAGFSGLTFYAVQDSYLTGEKCGNKCLIQDPDGFMSKGIRKLRNIKKLQIVDSKEFDERKLTDKEQQILKDCNSTSFYQFSLPAMGVASATSYFGVARSPWFQSRKDSVLQLAPVALACLLGYYMGQRIYLRRTDCPDSFVKYAPEGSIAKILKHHLNAPQDYELSEAQTLQFSYFWSGEGSQTGALVENEKDELENENDELENEKDEYVIPALDQQSLNKLVKDTQPSPIQQITSTSMAK